MFAVVYLATLIFSLILIAALDLRESKFACFVSAVLFGALWFCALPRPTLYIDTVRFFGTLDMTRLYNDAGLSEGFRYLFNTAGYDATPVMGLVMLFCSLFDNNGLLTGIVAFVDIFVCLMMVRAVALEYQSKAVMLWGSAYFLMAFNSNASVTGVRNFMVGALGCCLAFHCFRHGEQGVKAMRWLALYVPLALIHPFVLIIVFFQYAIYLFGKRKLVMALVYAVLLGQRMLQPLIAQVAKTFSYIPFFGSIAFKFSQYFGEEAYLASSTVFSRLRAIFLFLVFVTIIICAMVWLKKNGVALPSQMNQFAHMSICLSIGAWSDEQLFYRCVSCIMFFVSLDYASVLPVIIGKDGQRQSSRVTSSSPMLAGLATVLFMCVALVDNLRAGVRFNIVVPTFDVFVFIVIGLLAAFIAAFFSNRRWRCAYRCNTRCFSERDAGQ